MPEVLEHGGLGMGAFWPQECHLERLLLGETGGHDLAEQPGDFLVPQRPCVALERGAQHLGLALRPVEIDRVPVGVLGNAHLLRQQGPSIEQFLQLFIDRIDFGA